jgi:two-component system, response regulator YesN
MYRLLIVDDEDWIRERLRDTIDWSGLGIEVCGEARDGEEALDITARLLPDIVITDIRMPGIDGLEYIRRLREGNNRTKVIIISGYSDFEYARMAIKLGAFDYLLKPVEDEEIIGIISKCLEEISSEKKKDVIVETARKQMLENLPLLKKEFLLKLADGAFDNDDAIFREMDYLKLSWHGCNKICFIIELDENVSKKTCENWDRHLLKFVVSNIARDFVMKLGGGEIFHTESDRVVCLAFSNVDEKVLTRQVLSVSNGIRKVVRKVTGFSSTIGVGRVCSTLSGITMSFREAVEALQYKSYLGSDRIYDIRGIEMQRKVDFYKAADLEILLNNIKMGDVRNSLDVLDNMFAGLHDGREELCPLDLKLLYMDIMNPVLKLVSDANTAVEDFSNLSIKFMEQLSRLQTVNDFHTWLSDMVIRIIDLLGKHRNSKKRKVIEAAVEYVNRHYTEPITLNNIADRFFLNASYFCKIFKEEVGESFTKYFINLRIQKAKELLKDPTRKIYEIAGMVGYEDVQYFTRIFKATTGVSPVQYREKIK